MAQSNLHSANSDANLSKEGMNEDGWGLGGAIYRILAEAQALYNSRRGMLLQLCFQAFRDEEFRCRAYLITLICLFSFLC
jgi:hypothetical protein